MILCLVFQYLLSVSFVFSAKKKRDLEEEEEEEEEERGQVRDVLNEDGDE